MQRLSLLPSNTNPCLLARLPPLLAALVDGATGTVVLAAAARQAMLIPPGNMSTPSFLVITMELPLPQPL